MMAKRNNVAAILAVSLFFFSFGCGQPPNMVDADAGPDIMDDGGTDADSGVPPNPSDGGMDADGGGGESCTPTEDDPICEAASPGAECVCDTSHLSDMCALYPEMCAPGDGRNVCEPGEFNRCGFDLPMSMTSYSYEEFRHDCEPFINFDFWFGPGGEVTVQTFWRNGQLTMTIGSSIFVCGNEGKCWKNWANASNPDPEMGYHSTAEFSPDCRGMTLTGYRGGEIEPAGTTRYVFDREGA